MILRCVDCSWVGEDYQTIGSTSFFMGEDVLLCPVCCSDTPLFSISPRTVSSLYDKLCTASTERDDLQKKFDSLQSAYDVMFYEKYKKGEK